MADAASEQSGSRGGSSATGASQETGQKKKDRRTRADGQNDDLLEEKKSAEEAIHASMYALVKEKGAEPWQYSYAKILLEGLVAFLIVFNAESPNWYLDEDNWLWKLVRWAIFRSPVQALWGYDVYCKLLLALVVLVYTVLAGIAFLAWSMRKSEQSSWLKTLALVLQMLTDLLFGVLYMSILDYFVFMFACDFNNSPIMHHYFPDVQCLAMPHLVYLVLAGVTAVIFTVTSVAVQTAACDLNPTAKGLLASPAAIMKIKVVVAKAVFVTAADVFNFVPKPQSLLMVVACMYVLWLDLKTVPFLRSVVNYIWCGMWSAVLYTTCLYTALAFSPKRHDITYREDMTLAVLYGVWPAMAGGGLVAFCFHWYRMRAVKKFLDPNLDHSKLKKVHRFSNTDEVALLCRAMRKFDMDGVIDNGAADLGELIIKAGLATFPNSPQLLILLANFLMEVRKDGPASRTQLQLVAKHSPNFVERYQVFCTIENSKRLKESTDQGMDLHSYVEFKRNFRAVLKLHKDALLAMREMWSAMMKSEPNMVRLDGAVREADEAIERAYRVYRKVVERYPKNGKLLRVYGSFLEDVKNDFKNAQRVYSQAMRQGGTGNALMSMDFDFASQPGKPDLLLSMDINEDAIVLINAEGVIMMVSAGVTGMFGYNKAELEGENVAMLMPPPFSQRHASYLQHYKDTGEARILDSVKEVVAVHKDRHVFPVAICVTKLSGLGADAVFLGMLRPLSFSMRDVRAWLSPTGVITCCGPMFSAITGILPNDMVGSNIKSMLVEQEAFDVLLHRAAIASWDNFESHSLAMEITILNKYIGAVPCNAYFSMGGTEQTRVLVLHIARKDQSDDNLLVVDEQGQITFATNDLAVTLGYGLKDFLKLNLKQLLPAPTNAMHEKWLRDASPSYPVTSCRAGTIVNLVGSTNQHVPVRIQLSQREEPSGTKHVTRIWKASPSELLDDRRVHITAGYDGKIVAVEPQNSIFGFPSALLKGMNVCDVIDVFSDWKQRSGSGDMQLLMLALLDKEQEMPGAAWRIKITPPESAESTSQAAKAVHHGRANTRHLPKSAVMQANLVEAAQAGTQRMSAEDSGYHSDKPRIRLSLWRRELLVGSMELDARLRVRRADAFTGLIVGRPPSSILKQPISKFLNIPLHSSWDEIMGVKGARKNALKTAPTVGKVSPPRMFEGDHPDGGSLRVLLQGVVVTEALTGKSRIEVTVKPDITFAAAHSDIWSALKLNCFGEEEDERSSRSSSRSGSSAGEKGRQVPHQDSKAKQRVQLRDALEIVPPGDGEDAAQQPKESNSTAGGDFVKRWVQTMDANRASVGQGGKPSRLNGADASEAEDMTKPSKQEDWLKIAASMPDEAFAMPKPSKHHHHHHRESRPPSGDNASESDFSDGAASSQNEDKRSAYSSKVEVGHEDEILVDSRRGKALRRLLLLLTQPGMTTPIDHIKWRTIIILAIMLLIRIAFYVTTVFLMDEETVYINQVHKTAGAADRSQVATGRVAVAAYCRDRPDLMAGDNVCQTLSVRQVALEKLEQNLVDIEEYSHDVYLGHGGKVAKLHDPDTYNAWSAPDISFPLYLDNNPPTIVNETRSLWELSNRFVAAGRVMLWRINNQNSSTMMRSRAYNYITMNGLDAVFNGYTRALDSLMMYAWKQLSQIKGDIVILLVLEALVCVPLLTFWQWTLIRKAENVRMLHWMLMVSLPSPVLRALSSKPVKISDDSDDDSDNDSDAGGGTNVPRKAGGSEGGDMKPVPSAQSLPAPVATKSTADMDRPFLLGQQASTDVAMPVARPKDKASKTIKPSPKYFLLFLGPLALWFVTLIIVYSISLTDVDGLQGPLAALNMAMHVIYRFSHVRALAFFAMSQTDPLERQMYRLRMVDAVKALTSEYDTLLYGGMASTQAEDRFQQSVPAAAFILPAFSDMFFKATNCMRADQSTCYDESSPWYEATHHGLDSMMQRIISEMSLMTKDSDADLNIANNTRYRTMYRIGIADLYDGLADAAQLFVDYSVSRYKQVTQLQVILLVVLVIMIVLYVAFILRPYLALHRAELVKVAGFVSHVPQEVDVQAHVRRVLRSGLAPKNKKVKGAGGADEHLEPVGYGSGK